MTKQPIGPLTYGDRIQPWGRGVAASGFVFLSGIDGAADANGVAVEGIAAQTRLTLDRVHGLLADAGIRFDDIVQFDQFVADPADRGEYMRARDDWMTKYAPNLLAERSYASLLIYPALATAEMRVEVRAVAYCGSR